MSASTRQVNGNSGHTETTTVVAKNTFDYTGRLLTQARDDGQNTAYAYDGMGRTVSQTLPTGLDPNAKNKKNGTGAGPHLTGCGVGGTTPGCPGSGDLTMFGGQTARVFNDGLTPIAWATSTLSTDLVYGPQGADHQLTTTSSGTTSSWLYLDRQGSVRATAGADGVTTSASAYTDFGVLEPAAGTLYAGAGTEAAPGQEDKLAAVHLPVATTRTPVGYTGEQSNPVAGLQHYYARDYQPGLASWIQADTWAGIRTLGQTLNKYAYVLNNPTTLTDVLGNRPCAYEYNNGCHDTPQPSIFAPAPVAWHPPMLAPANPTPSDGPGTSEGGPSRPTDPSNPRSDSQQYEQGWRTVSGVLNFIGGAAGLLSLIPGPQQPIMLVIAGIASVSSLVVDCVISPDLSGCIVDAVFTLIGGAGLVVKAGLKEGVEQFVREAVSRVLDAVSTTKDSYDTSVCGGIATRGNWTCQLGTQ